MRNLVSHHFFRHMRKLFFLFKSDVYGLTETFFQVWLKVCSFSHMFESNRFHPVWRLFSLDGPLVSLLQIFTENHPSTKLKWAMVYLPNPKHKHPDETEDRDTSEDLGSSHPCVPSWDLLRKLLTQARATCWAWTLWVLKTMLDCSSSRVCQTLWCIINPKVHFMRWNCSTFLPVISDWEHIHPSFISRALLNQI